MGKKTKVMDGFSVVRSLAKAQQDGTLPSTPKKKPPPSTAAAKPAAPSPANNPHIVKTIQPTQRTIRCFSCGYEFKMSGTTHAIYCAKCREKIDMGDYVIDHPWSTEIKTGGTVHIKPSGRLENVNILAGNVIFEGSMDSHSSIECTQWLELAGDHVPNMRQTTIRNLRVAAGRSLVLKHKLQIHHLELFGTLDGDTEATGLVDIHNGGHLKGTLRGAHLQVEEGGGLSARVFIWPPASDGAKKK